MGAPKFNPKARTLARQRAVQALYQWELSAAPAEEIVAQFVEATWENMGEVDQAFFRQLVMEVIQRQAELDPLFTSFLDRALGQLDPVERCILRQGVYELRFCPEVPWKVAVNEAVELAKLFGADQSHKFINGILDKVARKQRGS